jgi:hypothetical protein
MATKSQISSKLAAHRFTHERYCGSLGYQPLGVWDYAADRPRKGFVFVGWCDAKALPFRARESGRAIMLYEEPREERILGFADRTRVVGGEEFWIHA